MPTVNIYLTTKEQTTEFQKIISDLRVYIADKLTYGDIKLMPEEISIRFLNISGGQMIGNIEVEIKAHAFPERIKKQDEICLEVMKYLKERLPEVGDIKVWLQLFELGHSW